MNIQYQGTSRIMYKTREKDSPLTMDNERKVKNNVTKDNALMEFNYFENSMLEE